jgi:hypothetical protein
MIDTTEIAGIEPLTLPASVNCVFLACRQKGTFGKTYGPEFLLWDGYAYRTLYLHGRAGRGLARTIYPFLPLTRDEIAARELDGVEPHGPLPATLDGFSVGRCMRRVGLPRDALAVVRAFVGLVDVNAIHQDQIA